jgi:hypothetical protein
VMDRARAFVADSFRGGAGRILTNTASFSVQYLNAALEELQSKLRNNGVITFLRDNVILGPIPAIAASDPSLQTFISYEGYFDGTAMNDLPKLPADVLMPQKLWERQVGSGLSFMEMTQPMEGLPSIMQGPFLGVWEYRQDRIYLTGSTSTEELRMRYIAQLTPLTAEDDLANTQISILASVNALAKLTAYHYALARGAVGATQMQADADRYTRLIVRQYTRRAQSVPYNRKPYGDAGDRSLSAYSRLPY